MEPLFREERVVMPWKNDFFPAFHTITSKASGFCSLSFTQDGGCNLSLKKGQTLDWGANRGCTLLVIGLVKDQLTLAAVTGSARRHFLFDINLINFTSLQEPIGFFWGWPCVARMVVTNYGCYWMQRNLSFPLGTDFVGQFMLSTPLKCTVVWIHGKFHSVKRTVHPGTQAEATTHWRRQKSQPMLVSLIKFNLI